MVTRTFIDTNIFVYALDASDHVRRHAANAVLRKALVDGTGVISTQVVSEFVAVLSRGRSAPSERARVAELAALMLEEWPVVPLTTSVTSLALRLWSGHALSFWDVQILAAARVAECQTIITADVHETIAGVRYVDPFM